MKCVGGQGIGCVILMMKYKLQNVIKCDTFTIKKQCQELDLHKIGRDPIGICSTFFPFFWFHYVTKNCLSQVLEDSGTGSDPDITCLYKIFLERSISYVITQIRNCVKLLNLALYQSF